jgi:hypothetical protein
MITRSGNLIKNLYHLGKEVRARQPGEDGFGNKYKSIDDMWKKELGKEETEE